MENIFRIKAVLIAAAAVAALALFAGCRHEAGSPADAAGPTTIKIGTRAAIGSTVDGISLSSVRIVAVASGSGRVEFNRYRSATVGDLGFEDGGFGADAAGSFIVEVLPGSYDFYVIANELDAHTSALDALRTRADLQAVKLTAQQVSGLTEASMVCVGQASAVVQNVPKGEDRPARVSIDGGDTWSDRLDVELLRAAAKLTVKVRKQTTVEDTFAVKGAALSGTPSYSYLLPKAYDGALNGTANIFSGSAAFTANSETYTTVFSDYILPEYLTADPADAASATQLDLTADYSVAGGAPDEVTYTMPLLGDVAAGRQMARNLHYTVNVTISGRGHFEYTPYVVYRVAKWYEASDDPANVKIDDIYKITWGWAGNPITEDGGRTIRVANNTVVTMTFTLDEPKNALWTAQLSNPHDFYFDETAGVRQGVARQGFENRIVVRPRGEVSTSDVQTEIFITLRNGTSEIEYDLLGDGTVGAGNRYVIKQIPN